MDSTITGLNKVICNAVQVNGEYPTGTVTITNTTNTWTASLSNGVATFLIPSVPVPARKNYTVTFGNFTKTIPMGYGEVITVTLADGYDYVIEKDFNQFKNEVNQTIVNQLYDRDDPNRVAFNFGIDNDGRYGYVKKVNGADTVIPFRTGQETLCYSLGTGRTFNIQTACQTIKNTYGIDVDYRDLTSSNFVCQPTDGGDVTKNGSESGDVSFSWITTGVYTPPTLTYNSSMGTLTVTGSTWQGKYYREGASGGASFDTSVKSTSIKAYLIVTMNA